MSRFSKTYNGSTPSDDRKLVIDAVVEIIESEPELDGAMPDSMFASLCSSKETAEEHFRSAIRVTKANILKRVKALK